MIRLKSFFNVLIFCLLGGTLTACAQSGRKTETAQPAVAAETLQTEKLTRAEFERKVADLNAAEWKYLGEKPCVIDFYADWCGPCKQLSPILDKAVSRFEGRVLLYKINVDEERELAAAFGVRSIPMLLYVPMEGAPQASVGLTDESTIVSTIQKVLFPDSSSDTGK